MSRTRTCPRCGTTFPDEILFCGHDGTITVQTQDPSNPDPRLGQQLGQYVVVAHVADGAMGRVYEGRHVETRARMAVKILHPHVATDNVAVERFKREYEAARDLAHPYIVHVVDFGQTHEGSYYLTMEYLEGEELSRLIAREGPQPPARMVRIAAQAALALQHAHSFGVIHRDLKPDNVFLCRSAEGDVVKVLDFGSVKLQMETGPKLTAFGTTLGSPYYMSPEQAMGKLDVDHRTDVFALAAILYEIATGRVAFEGSQVAEILMKIMSHHPVPPTSLNPRYPAGFDDVIERGIQKKKEERYASVLELVDGVLASLGLAGNAAAWAATPFPAIDAAVAQATPPAPKPFGASAPGSFGASAPGSFGAGAPASNPPASSSSSAGPMLALAGIAFVLVVGTGIAVWALFG